MYTIGKLNEETEIRHNIPLNNIVSIVHHQSPTQS